MIPRVIYGNQGQTMMNLYTSETIKHPMGITLKKYASNFKFPIITY